MKNTPAELRYHLEKAEDTFESQDQPVIIEKSESVGIMYEIDGIRLVKPLRAYVLKGKRLGIFDKDLFTEVYETKQIVNIGGTYSHYKNPEHRYTLIDVVVLEGDSKD